MNNFLKDDFFDKVIAPTNLFLVALFVNNAGDQLFNLALSIYVFRLSNSPFIVGLIFSSSYLGSILGYLLSPWVKKIHPIKVLNFTDLTSGFVAMAVCLAPLQFIPLFQLVLGSLRAIQKPVLQKMAHRFVDENQQLTKVNARMQMTVQIATLIGISLASLAAVSQDMAKLILWLNAMSFWMSLLLLFPLRNKFEGLNSVSEVSFSWGQQLIKPLRLLGEKNAFFLFVPTSIALGINVAINSQLVNFANQFKNPSRTYVFIELSMAIGLLLGSKLIISRGSINENLISMKFSSVVWGGLLAMALFVASFSGAYPFLAIFFVVSAVSDSMSAIHQSTMALNVFAGESLHEALSLRFLLRQLSKAFMTIVMGFIITKMGSKNGFLLASVLLMCCFLPILFNFRMKGKIINEQS